MYHILSRSLPRVLHQCQRIDLVFSKIYTITLPPLAFNNIYNFLYQYLFTFYHKSIVIHHLLLLRLRLHHHHSIEQVVLWVCIVYQLCIELIQETQVYLFLFIYQFCPSRFHPSSPILITFFSRRFYVSRFSCFVVCSSIEYIRLWFCCLFVCCCW